MDLSNFSRRPDRSNSSDSPLFKPENQGKLHEFITSTMNGDGRQASHWLRKIAPSNLDRAIARQEIEMVETKGKVQRRLIALMGEALYKDAEMRLTTQNQMTAMTLSRQKMEHYAQEAEKVTRLYIDMILKFSNDFVGACENVQHLPDVIKQEALPRIQAGLISQLLSLDGFLKDFEATAQRQLLR